jgi:SAM-dependent methyltransferase
MSAKWTAGYVSDVAYTLGFYRELAPSFLNYVCIANGVQSIPTSRRLRYCELGCGRGYGTTLLAAANPDVDFVGIDFNPAHIGEARGLAAKAQITNVTFVEASFGDAARSTEALLSEFDIIASHGVYTWISGDVRNDMHDFIRSKLVSGGIIYISYNALPGWASAGPIQRLLKEFADRSSGESLVRIARGRAVLKELVEKSSAYIAQNPAVKSRLAAMERQDQHYLVHEFLHDHWQPLYVTEAIAALAESKLTFIGSATVAENRLALAVPKNLVEIVQSAPDVATRELLKDFAVNKQFRRDVYVKGPIRLSNDAAAARFRELSFALTGREKQLPEKWRIPAGEANLKPAQVEAVVSCVAGGPATAAEIIGACVKARAVESHVPAIIEVMVHNGVLAPCRRDAEAVDHGPGHRLNRSIFETALSADSHRFLAAPVLGSAISASHFDRLAVPVLQDDPDVDDRTAAGKLFDRLKGAGRSLMRDNKPVEQSETTVEEVAKMIRTARESTLPRWRSLGVIGPEK